MAFVRTRDGTGLFYVDWGRGRPVVFLAGAWFGQRMWEFQLMPLAFQGLRCIAYDRRGHGRSDWPWTGHDFDTLADDLATLLERLELYDVTLVAHAMGCGEAVRYLSRYGSRRVARLVCLSPLAPEPNGVGPEVDEEQRVLRTADRPKWHGGSARQLFGADLPGVELSEELLAWFVAQSLDCSAKAALDCNLVVSTTDLRPALRRIDVPTLVIHGASDSFAPLESCGRRTAELVDGSELIVYDNCAHAPFVSHADRLESDLLGFVGGSS